MKKTISVLLTALLAAAVAISATGCGGSSEEQTSTVPTIPKATNATTTPTVPSTAPRTTTPRQAATTPSGAAGTTDPSAAQAETEASLEGNYLVSQAAYAYFSVSEDVGATIQYNGTETTPSGTLFYFVTVYFAGDAFPLYVSEDGMFTYEPEAFYTINSMAPQIDVTEAATEAAADYYGTQSAVYDDYAAGAYAYDYGLGY